jgi:hypothetical protein
MSISHGAVRPVRWAMRVDDTTTDAPMLLDPNA